MNAPFFFTPDEIGLVADEQFFRAKARIMKKVRETLDLLHLGLKAELAGATLLAPKDFDSTRSQFVKGDQLEDFPYQYWTFPSISSGMTSLPSARCSGGAIILSL